MSKYAEYDTQFRDPTHLCAALTEAGFTPEIHEDGAHLFGYRRDRRPEKAHIIIRRRQVGRDSNDIGFQRQADGTYKAIISEFDRQAYDDAWLSKVKQFYQESRTMEIARTRGYVFRGREVIKTEKGQRVRLLFGVC